MFPYPEHSNLHIAQSHHDSHVFPPFFGITLGGGGASVTRFDHFEEQKQFPYLDMSDFWQKA